MFSESEAEDNKARVMIRMYGLTDDLQVERYNTNDTIVSQSGVFFSFTQSDPTKADTKVFEKFELVNYKELTLEIPILRSNNKSDPGQFFIKEAGNAIMYLDDTPPQVEDELWFYFSFVSAAQFYERYPISFGQALSKIGGILGLINIGLFLGWLHSGHFDEQL